MNIRAFEGGYDKNLCYLIWCEKSKIASIVDPSVNISPIIDLIDKSNLKLTKIFITHTHHDHILYLDKFLNIYPKLDVLCHENYLKSFDCDITKLSDSEIITLGQEILIALHTPGHHGDSICYWNKKNNMIFTGDTIFVGRTGRTLGRHSNIEDLYNSVYKKIFQIPHETVIYPGHNYGYKKFITIKENINYSDFFNCKSFEEFKYVMKKFEDGRK